MQKIIIACFLAAFFGSSCGEKKAAKPSTSAQKINIQKEELNALQGILDSSKLKGAILIYDSQNKIFYSNDFKWAEKQRLPASTFKIPNSIIALETGIVENDSSLFTWNKEPRGMKIWEQDLIFKEAFHFSCVPCYQDVARAIGVENMKSYVQKLQYGSMQIDTSTIDLFWLEGKSGISQFEQIDFLKRFYESELPISKRTETIMKKMIVIDSASNYVYSGKTGLSIQENRVNGWFVGYVSTEKGVYFFATNIEPGAKKNMTAFLNSRMEVSLKALKQIGVLE